MSPPSYTIPETVAEALVIAQKHPGDYIYLAGGTDVQIHRKQGLSNHQHLIDLADITELRRLFWEENRLNIGSMVTLDELISSPEVVTYFPLLVTAAKSVATPVIRKTATVGGNLLVKNRCFFYNQSKAWRMAIGSCLRAEGERCQVTGSKTTCYARNVSDLAPALIALDAQITIKNQHTTRRIPLLELYVSDGIHTHRHLEEDGILSRVEITPPNGKSWFRKLRLRQSLDFTSLTIAATVDAGAYARVCINGVSMAPVLLKGPLSDLTLEALLRQARKACQTVDNDLLSRAYRREMMAIYLEEWWHSIQPRQFER